VAYAIFDTPAIHRIPGVKELAQAGSAMVPPLAIATAQLPQVLADPSVNIELPRIQDELAATPVHLPWTVNAGRRDDGAVKALQAWQARERKPPHPRHQLNP
jgi:hypothetical protein